MRVLEYTYQYDCVHALIVPLALVSVRGRLITLQGRTSRHIGIERLCGDEIILEVRPARESNGLTHWVSRFSWATFRSLGVVPSPRCRSSLNCTDEYLSPVAIEAGDGVTLA